MALFKDCPACQDGQHEHHRETVTPPPRGGVGGVVCRCVGDCAERNAGQARYADLRDLLAGRSTHTKEETG